MARERTNVCDMNEVTATAKMHTGKVAAAEVPMTATEVHVAASMSAAVATTTMTAATSRKGKTARRQRCGSDKHNDTSMEFRHRSLPPTHDITRSSADNAAATPRFRREESWFAHVLFGKPVPTLFRNMRYRGKRAALRSSGSLRPFARYDTVR